MKLEFVTDEKGRKKAVQLPIKDWDKIKRDLEELNLLKNKKQFMLEFA